MKDHIAEALNLEPIDFIFDPPENKWDPTISKEEVLIRNSEIVVCDRCGVSGNRPNMMRWHFDKCKTLLRNCEHCSNTIPRQGIKDYLYNQKKFCNRVCYMASKKGKPAMIMTEDIKQKLSIVAKEREQKKKTQRISCD